MQDLAIFAVASDRSRWLAARSAAISRNIANADTPGYKARDVAPFEAALVSAGAQMRATSGGHFDGEGGAGVDVVARPSSTPKQSGNTVSLETELMQLGDARSQHAFVTGIVSAFHRMLLSSAKG